MACGSFAVLTSVGNSGEIPGLTRSGVGDERIAGPLSRGKRRLGKEIREVDPKPEYPACERYVNRLRGQDRRRAPTARVVFLSR